MWRKLPVYGFKNFSKFSASGEDTPLILENLLKSHNLKYIKKLEFDPYLCEKSYMEPLKKVVKRYKDIRDINIVIRRLDYTNESDILMPFMMRLTKLLKIRLELTKIEKLNDKGLINLAWSMAKNYSVRECEQIMIGMDHISEFASMHFAKYGRKLILCKKFKKILQRAVVMGRADMSIQGVSAEFLRKIKKCVHFREMDFSVVMPTGWLSMSTEVDESAVVNLKMIANQKSLEKLYLTFGGNPVILETLQGLSVALPTLKYLRWLGLEFLNSRMSEMEVVILAQLLPQLKLERFILKVIQYPNVSEECLYYLMNTISKLPNLKRFDIYFRRLTIPEEIIQELMKKIHTYEHMSCSFSNQCLHIYRN